LYFDSNRADNVRQTYILWHPARSDFELLLNLHAGANRSQSGASVFNNNFSKLSKLTFIVVLTAISANAPAVTIAAPAKSKADKQSSTQSANVAKFRQLINDTSPERAEEQIAAFLKTSDDAAVRELHADILYKLARYHYAMDELKRAMQTTGENPEDSLLMGKICQNMHKSKEAIEWYKKFIASSPSDERTGQYEALQQALQSSVASEAEKHRKVQAEVGNYLAAVTQNAMMRWSSPENIKVYIKDGAGLEGYRPEFEEALRQAFDEWSEASNGKVNFSFLQSPENADMTVTWTSDLHAPALKAEAGLATTSYGPNGLSKADIQLLTVDPLKDGPVGKNMLYNVCLHEIGHALGLEGHSPTEGDIMYSTLIVQQGLSDRDINTLLALYNSDLKSSTALSDKDEYGRPLPPSVMAERLTNVGSAAAMSGDFEKAIEKLQAALAINPDQELARKNLSVAANNLAIANNTEPERALSLLRLALYWDPKNDASRSNLNAALQNQGKDPKSFKTRVECAESCQSHKDFKGAIVEYSEALSIKSDEVVASKLKQLKASEGKPKTKSI
jgi:tetratricopeptide (TPR) repeat protein